MSNEIYKPQNNEDIEDEVLEGEQESEKDAEEDTNVEDVDSREGSPDKEIIENLASSLKNVCDVFKERESKRLSPMIKKDSLNRLSGIVISIEDISLNIKEIIVTLSDIGNVAKGSINDNTDSLGRLIRSLESFRKNIVVLGEELKDEDDKQFLEDLKHLDDLCKNKASFINRKREAIFKYERTR
jgi:hypothetical protein